jgi:hypothetical protein
METKPSPFERLSQPAQRALANAGVTTLQQLSQLTEKQFLSLHGVGKGSLPVVKAALAAENLAFTEKKA